MDTKLKRYNVLLKICAFVMIGALSCAVMLTVTDLYKQGVKLEQRLNTGFNAFDVFGVFGTDLQSATNAWQYTNDRSNASAAINLVLRYKSEQNILDGNTVSAADINAQEQSLYNEHSDDIEQELSGTGTDPANVTQEMVQQKFQEEYKSDIANIKNDLIQGQIKDFRGALATLQDNPNIYYYLNVGGKILSNKDFKTISKSKFGYISDAVYGPDNTTVVEQGAFAFKEGYVNRLVSGIRATQHAIRVDLVIVACCLLASLLGLGYLIFAAGKKASDPLKGVHLLAVDKLYNEVTLALLALCGFALWGCAFMILKKLFNQVFMLVMLAAVALLATALILMLVRHLKNRTMLKHTLIFTALRVASKGAAKVFSGGSLLVKSLVLVGVLGLLTALPWAFLFTVPLALFLTYRQVTRYLALKKGVAQIRDGAYQERIEVAGGGELAALAADINDISAGLAAEVERRLKSERLKTELIVNVSHDIRTPLTSVITYVDLLKGEKAGSKNAQKYLEVLDEKSNRLKILIDDLFEASKAASGNIPVTFEAVDVNALIAQALGELDDKIKASSLDFRVQTPEEKVTARADGKLCWRVLANLLSNALKYSLPGSRVYVSVAQDARGVCLEVKNISADELTIPEGEIVERFKRGDAARGGEGSGLGLDIARSLMRCQNGELVISIDGDLFKATMKLDRWMD